MLTRRRKLLQYLRRSDFDTYSALILRLGLRDRYAKQVIQPCIYIYLWSLNRLVGSFGLLGVTWFALVCL